MIKLLYSQHCLGLPILYISPQCYSTVENIPSRRIDYTSIGELKEPLPEIQSTYNRKLPIDKNLPMMTYGHNGMDRPNLQQFYQPRPYLPTTYYENQRDKNFNMQADWHKQPNFIINPGVSHYPHTPGFNINPSVYTYPYTSSGKNVDVDIILQSRPMKQLPESGILNLINDQLEQFIQYWNWND